MSRHLALALACLLLSSAVLCEASVSPGRLCMKGAVAAALYSPALEELQSTVQGPRHPTRPQLLPGASGG